MAKPDWRARRGVASQAGIGLIEMEEKLIVGGLRINATGGRLASRIVP